MSITIPKLSFACFYLLFLLSGCVKSQNETDLTEPEEAIVQPVDFDLKQIKERGSLTAIVDNSTTSYFVHKGQPMGYEYELLNRLALYLGVELKLIITKDIEDAFLKLNRGEGDIIAYSLTVTKKRTERISFTDHLTQSRQVLVQKKPDDWRQMKLHEIERY